MLNRPAVFAAAAVGILASVTSWVLGYTSGHKQGLSGRTPPPATASLIAEAREQGLARGFAEGLARARQIEREEIRPH